MAKFVFVSNIIRYTSICSLAAVGRMRSGDRLDGLIPFIISCWLAVLEKFSFSYSTVFMTGSPGKSPIGESRFYSLQYCRIKF